MKRIVGIDCSSRSIAIVSFDDNELSGYILLENKEKETQKRLFELSDMFERMIKIFDPDLVILEDSIYISNFRTSKVLSEINGYVKLHDFCGGTEISYSSDAW